MRKNLTKILIILTKKNKLNFFFISFLSVIKALIEILGIGLLIPILTLLSNVDKKNSIFIYIPYLKKFTDDEIIFIFIIFFILVYLFKTIYVIFFNIYYARYAHNLYAEIAEKLLKSYLGNNFIFFIQTNSAKLIRNIASESNLFAVGIIANCIIIISNFFLFLGICILITFYNYHSIFVIIILLIVCVTIVKSNNKKFSKWGEVRHIESAKFIQKINEVIGSIKEVILYDKQNFFSRQIQKPLRQFANASIYKDAFTSITSPIIEFVGIFIFFSFFSYLIFYSNREYSEIIVIFGIFAYASIKLLPNLIQSVKCYQTIIFNFPSVNTIFNDLENNKNKIKNYRSINNVNNIVLDKVNFTYPGKSFATLKNINLKFNTGDKIGIIGETGSGKTTLINLISGLLFPTSGKITINSLRESNSQKSKLNIGYVSQFVYLSDDSVLFNIALSDEISKEKMKLIKNLLKILNLNNFKNRNVKLSLGERGSKMSGGQIQRIGIARALYREPSLLVLDEATNALDEKTEDKILDHLFSKFQKKIIIFCTHKKKILSYCNKIIEVKDQEVNFLLK